MLRRFAACLPLVFISAWISPAAADFPALYNSEQGQGKPMPAAEAAAALKLPAGFQATLFAAEPEVQNPIAMAWDAKGRLWVAENYTYAERSKRFELALNDRVVVLEDTNGDGKADKRTVFTDDVQMLTGIEIGRGGVWLMCPPQVIFIPDANGDAVPDAAPRVVLDGFTVAKDNYHNFANGLKWGPDGWLYGRCGHSCPGRLGIPGTPDDQRIPIVGGLWRFEPERKVVEVLTHGTTNPWGHDWDQHGEGFFINTVNGHLWHLMHGAHFKEGTDPNPGVYQRLDMIADHWHFDTKGGWQSSRDGKADSLGGGHAHIGMMIYQAEAWPEEWRNRLFTLNMHGRRANVERLEREGSAYVGKHQADVFFASDTWFRGIEISTGPDGQAYILDWSDTGECHESTGVHRDSGRIFKITYGEAQKPDLSALGALTAQNIGGLVRNSNAWFDRMARVELMPTPYSNGAVDYLQRVPPAGVVAALKDIVAKDSNSVHRLRALWSLHAAGEAKPELLRPLLKDPDEHIRVWAIRLLTDTWSLDTGMGPVASQPPVDEPELQGEFVAMAKGDASGLVRLVLAQTLQRLPVARRAALASAIAAHAEDAQDHSLPAMVWYGLIPVGDSDPLALVEVAKGCQWPDTLRWITRNLAARMEKDSAPLNALLAAVQPARHGAVLKGIAEALQGWRKAPKPAAWDAFAKAASAPEDAALVRDLGTVFGDGRALDEVKKLVLDAKAYVPSRVAALKTLIDNRPPDLRQVCEALLDVRDVNAVAVRGLALFDDPAIGVSLAKGYRKFSTSARPAVLDTLVSRPFFVKPLLAEMAAGRIPRVDLTAFHARQIRAFNDEALNQQLKDAWGELRESAGDKKQLITSLKEKLTPDVLGKATLGNGRILFTALCSSCHTMYGSGGKVGPDLTGSGRANLDYLLENIADPSGVVSADFRMSILTLKDGRVLSGVASQANDRTVTLRTLTEELKLERSEVAKQEVSPVSMMPEGLLLALQPDQVRDLIAYLMHPSQVPLPK